MPAVGPGQCKLTRSRKRRLRRPVHDRARLKSPVAMTAGYDDLHHGFGAFRHSIASHRNGIASPSATKMSPTSWPFALSAPQVRANLQTHLPTRVTWHGQEAGE